MFKSNIMRKSVNFQSYAPHGPPDRIATRISCIPTYMSNECIEIHQELGDFSYLVANIKEDNRAVTLGAFRYTNGDVYIG